MGIELTWISDCDMLAHGLNSAPVIGFMQANFSRSNICTLLALSSILHPLYLYLYIYVALSYDDTSYLYVL
jgi:hypothetical protein